jgi:hypothetical protein
MVITLPTAEEKTTIIQEACEALKGFTYYDRKTNEHSVLCCAVCDKIPNTNEWRHDMALDDFVNSCQLMHLEKEALKDEFPVSLIEYYTARHPELKYFVLSPETIVTEEATVVLCKVCYDTVHHNRRSRKTFPPPPFAIARGFLTGEAPREISELNEAEKALLSPNRHLGQVWSFYGGAQQHVKGWHTIFSNVPGNTMAHVNSLTDISESATIACVLCGPFTKTQQAIVKKEFVLRPRRLEKAFKWLKKNHFVYRDIEIPDLSDMPVPVVIQGSSL